MAVSSRRNARFSKTRAFRLDETPTHAPKTLPEESRGRPGGSRGRPGGALDRPGGLLRASWRFLGAWWGVLEAILVLFLASCSDLGFGTVSEAVFDPSGSNLRDQIESEKPSKTMEGCSKSGFSALGVRRSFETLFGCISTPFWTRKPFQKKPP